MGTTVMGKNIEPFIVSSSRGNPLVDLRSERTINFWRIISEQKRALHLASPRAPPFSFSATTCNNMFSNSSENCPGKKTHQCLAQDCIILEAEHPLLCDPMADTSRQKQDEFISAKEF
jgi:hypothetical protein